MSEKPDGCIMFFVRGLAFTFWRIVFLIGFLVVAYWLSGGR